MTGTKIEQAYVSARFEWLKLGTNHEEAMAALQEINHLGEPIEDCLLDKKKYLMRVIKAYERMSKTRVYVSEGGSLHHSVVGSMY
jgi:hypothetical protein